VRWLAVADLMLFAAAWVFREPIPEGWIFFTVSHGHGFTVSDIPAAAALVAAAWLAGRSLLRGRRLGR
jgi:hypothetical protein